MIGLYVHIPFCRRRCHYCDFVISLAASNAAKDAFLEALMREVQIVAPGFSGERFDTLYLGGGTPSLLDRVQIEQLFLLIRKNFNLKPDAEITLEANPEDVEKNKADVWTALGINRISLGAQSFNDATLKNLNRTHDAAKIREAFRALRGAGFQNISLDLILSLPSESLLEVRHSLQEATRLGPKHLSLYELTLEPGTVFFGLEKTKRLSLPPEEAQLAMLVEARDFLKREGFHHYELLSYAKPGFESRHNRLYWTNESTLGLGPGAFSYIKGRRYRHSRTVDQYLEKAQCGDWTALEEETLGALPRQVESLVLSLRLTEGVEWSRVESLPEEQIRRIDDLIVKGLLVQENNSLRLSDRGQLFAETVFSDLSFV